ncbi:hypothetical protein HDU67_000235 [Dinochytrium kinnereticum]|nr:hypothetical protein HDU67_000235 [Dinochytrium kinnereticum]
MVTSTTPSGIIRRSRASSKPVTNPSTSTSSLPVSRRSRASSAAPQHVAKRSRTSPATVKRESSSKEDDAPSGVSKKILKPVATGSVVTTRSKCTKPCCEGRLAARVDGGRESFFVPVRVMIIRGAMLVSPGATWAHPLR